MHVYGETYLGFFFFLSFLSPAFTNYVDSHERNPAYGFPFAEICISWFFRQEHCSIFTLMFATSPYEPDALRCRDLYLVATSFHTSERAPPQVLVVVRMEWMKLVGGNRHCIVRVRRDINVFVLTVCRRAPIIHSVVWI